MQGLFLLLEVLMTARFMRTVAPLVAASAACGLMVGCGGGSPEAKSSPPSSTTTSAASPTTSKTTSTSATPTSQTSNATYAGAPGVPEAAKHKTDAGAIAFARHYMQLVSDLGQRPRTGVLEPLASSSCGTCKNQAEAIRTLQARGQHYDGPQSTSLNGEIKTSASGRIVEVRVNQPALRLVDASGATVKETAPRGNYSMYCHLLWVQDGGWRLERLTSDSASS